MPASRPETTRTRTLSSDRRCVRRRWQMQWPCREQPIPVYDDLDAVRRAASDTATSRTHASDSIPSLVRPRELKPASDPRTTHVQAAITEPHTHTHTRTGRFMINIDVPQCSILNERIADSRNSWFARYFQDRMALTSRALRFYHNTRHRRAHTPHLDRLAQNPETKDHNEALNR